MVKEEKWLFSASGGNSGAVACSRLGLAAAPFRVLVCRCSFQGKAWSVSWALESDALLCEAAKVQ